MEKKKEVTVKKESPVYDGLDKNDLKALKTAYRSLENNMLKVSQLVYKLKEQNEEEFTSFCKNELGVSNGTISKFYSVGKIIALNSDKVVLPNTYTKIYALNKVSANLEDFHDYVKEEKDKELNELSVREIDSAVRTYIADGVEEAEEVEEAEIDNMLDIVNKYLNSTNAPNNVLEAFNFIIYVTVRRCLT